MQNYTISEIEMKGTDKQVSWASDVRKNTLYAIYRAKNRDSNPVELNDHFGKTELNEKDFSAIEKFLPLIEKIDSAQYWINNRKSGARKIFIDLHKGVVK